MLNWNPEEALKSKLAKDGHKKKWDWTKGTEGMYVDHLFQWNTGIPPLTYSYMQKDQRTCLLTIRTNFHGKLKSWCECSNLFWYVGIHGLTASSLLSHQSRADYQHSLLSHLLTLTSEGNQTGEPTTTSKLLSLNIYAILS